MRVLNSEGVPRKRQGEGWWILLQEGADAVDAEAGPPRSRSHDSGGVHGQFVRPEKGSGTRAFLDSF